MLSFSPVTQSMSGVQDGFTMRKPRLSPLQRREIALAALVDPRTLERLLRGEAVRGLGHERIRRILEQRGLLHLLPERAKAAR